MAKQLDTSPNQADVSANVRRERLRSKVSHVAEILHEQGPIGTFIHTKPLHSLEHLHFERAVTEAERLTGGQAYLPNGDFRRLYRTGRITDHDVKEALVVSHRSNHRLLRYASTPSSRWNRSTPPSPLVLASPSRAGTKRFRGSFRCNTEDPVRKVRDRPSLELGLVENGRYATRCNETELESSTCGTALL
jgi:hypothetical protein